jgi:hypothetical protein
MQNPMHPLLLIGMDTAGNATSLCLLKDLRKILRGDELERRYYGTTPSEKSRSLETLLAGRMVAVETRREQPNKWRFNAFDQAAFLAPAALTEPAGFNSTEASHKLRDEIDKMRNAHNADLKLPGDLHPYAYLESSTVYVTLVVELHDPASRENLLEMLKMLALAYAPDNNPVGPLFIRVVILAYLPRVPQLINAYAAGLTKENNVVGQVSQAYAFLKHSAEIFGEALAKVGQNPTAFPIESFLFEDVRPDNTRLSMFGCYQAGALFLRQLIFYPLLISLEQRERRVEPEERAAIAAVRALQVAEAAQSEWLSAPTTETKAKQPPAAGATKSGRGRTQVARAEVLKVGPENNATVNLIPQPNPQALLRVRLLGIAELELDPDSALDRLTRQTLAWYCGDWAKPEAVNVAFLEKQGRVVATNWLNFFASEVRQQTGLAYRWPYLNDLQLVKAPGRELLEVSLDQAVSELLDGAFFNWANLPDQMLTQATLLAYQLDPSVNAASNKPGPSRQRASLIARLDDQAQELVRADLVKFFQGGPGGLFRVRLVLGESAARLAYTAALLKEHLADPKGLTLPTPTAAANRLIALGQAAQQELASAQAHTPRLLPTLAPGLAAGITGGTLAANFLALPGLILPALFTGGLTALAWRSYQTGIKQTLDRRDFWLNQFEERFQAELAQVAYFYLGPAINHLNWLFNAPQGLKWRLEQFEKVAGRCVETGESLPAYPPEPYFYYPAQPEDQSGIPLLMRVLPGDLLEEARQKLVKSNLLWNKTVAEGMEAFIQSQVFEPVFAGESDLTPGGDPKEAKKFEQAFQLQQMEALVKHFREILLDFGSLTQGREILADLLTQDIDTYLQKHPTRRTQAYAGLERLASLNGRLLDEPFDCQSFIFSPGAGLDFFGDGQKAPSLFKRSIVSLHTALIDPARLVRVNRVS